MRYTGAQRAEGSDCLLEPRVEISTERKTNPPDKALCVWQNPASLLQVGGGRGGIALPLSSWQYSSPASVTPPRDRVAAEKAARGPRLALPGPVPIFIPNSSPTGRRWALLPDTAGALRPVGPRRATRWSRGATTKAPVPVWPPGAGGWPRPRYTCAPPSCCAHGPAPPFAHRAPASPTPKSLTPASACVRLSPFETLRSPKARQWSTPWSQDGVPIAPHASHCFSRGWHGRRGAPRRAPRTIWDRVRGTGSQLASAECFAAPTCPRLKPWVLPAPSTSQQRVTRYRDTIPCSPISFTFHHAHAFLLKFYSVKH